MTPSQPSQSSHPAHQPPFPPIKRSALTGLSALLVLLLLFLLLSGLSGCKRATGGPSAAEVEALDYVRLVQIALTNAYAEKGQQAIPATPCTDPMFGMKKTTKNLILDRCTASMTDPANPLVTAVFNDDLAVLGNGQGAKIVQISDLPELP